MTGCNRACAIIDPEDESGEDRDELIVRQLNEVAWNDVARCPKGRTSFTGVSEQSQRPGKKICPLE